MKTIRKTWLRLIAKLGNKAPEGVIGRYDHLNGNQTKQTKIRLESRRGDRLHVRTATAYFQRLDLKRGDQIIITRYEIRADNGQQYIQALTIKKL